MSTALIFGANGISGLALISRLTSRPTSEWRKIIALSRSAPKLEHDDPRVEFHSVDLLGDVGRLTEVLRAAGATEANHAFFYAYVAKQDEDELIEVNRTLFGHALEAVTSVCKNLDTFQLQTGYKYYGVHKGGDYLAPLPFKEDSPQHPGNNFYFVQEAMLRDAAKKAGWGWIVTRPNFIIGASKGNFMSLATTVALYAIARKSLNQPLVFPGSAASYRNAYDHSTAVNNADFQIFLTTKPEARNRVFNIADGESSRFSDLWPKIAAYFDVPLATPPAESAPPDKTPGKDIVLLHDPAQWADENASALQRLAHSSDMDDQAFEYATWDFLGFATSRTWEDKGDLSAARSLGWDRKVDTWEEGYVGAFQRLSELGIIPAQS